MTSLRALRGVAGGFLAELTWTARGSVMHFAHRHFRKNDYRARPRIVASDDLWKIDGLEVLELERTR